jgi:hypothetical protein
LRDYLQQVFAGEWNNQTITQLLQKEGAKSTNLEAWLRDEFFVQHCKVFQNRPFHLAYLGWPQRWFFGFGQLPQIR